MAWIVSELTIAQPRSAKFWECAEWAWYRREPQIPLRRAEQSRPERARVTPASETIYERGSALVLLVLDKRKKLTTREVHLALRRIEDIRTRDQALRILQRMLTEKLVRTYRDLHRSGSPSVWCKVESDD